jgi:hypothetical protein
MAIGIPDDRPSALLTPRQRDALRGESDLNARGERAARARIRERLQASIFDLQLIASTLPLDDLDKALSEPEEYESKPGTQPPMTNALHTLPEMVYLSYRDSGPAAEGQPDGWQTALTVERGIESALTRMGIGYDSIDVEIQVERAEKLEEFAEGDLASYSPDRLTQLHRAGVIDGDQFSQAWSAMQSDDE